MRKIYGAPVSTFANCIYTNKCARVCGCFCVEIGA